MDNTEAQLFYNKLTILMHERFLTLTQFSKEIGIPVRTISEWKLRLPSAQNLICVARYFYVSLDYLLGLTDERRPLINKSEPRSGKKLELIHYLDSQSLSDRQFGILLQAVQGIVNFKYHHKEAEQDQK